MAGADDDSAAWAAQFAGLLANQAAAVLELFSVLAAESGDAPEGDEVAWVRSAERIEALWRQFLQDQTEDFVAAWPDFVRELIGLLPLLGRSQSLFAMLAQLWPLLVGPEVLRRAIETGGEGMVRGLEQFLADLCRGKTVPDDPADGPAEPGRMLP